MVNLALLLLVGLELVLRWQTQTGRFSGIETYRAAFPDADESFLAEFGHEMDAAANGFDHAHARFVPVAWEPYTYWRGRPAAGQHVSIAPSGLRTTVNAIGDAAAAELDRGALRVLTFGGSTMWGMGARDGETIASQLARELRAAGLAVQVENFAQIGYVSSQDTLALWKLLSSGQRPDAAVFLSGFNDIAAAVMNERPGLSIDNNLRREELLASRRSPWELLRWAGRNTALARCFSGGRQADPPVGLLQAGSLDQWGLDVWNYHAGQSALVDAWAEAFDFEAVHAWQPVVYFKRRPSDVEQREITGREKYAQVWAAVHALAADNSLRSARGARPSSPHYLYLGEAFNTPEWDGRTAFFDRCHLVEPAQGEIARRLAEALLPRLRARLTDRATASQASAASLSTERRE